MDRSIETIRKEASLYAARNSFTHIRSILTPIVESIRSAQGIRSIRMEASRTTQASNEQIDFLQGAHEQIAHEGEELLNLLQCQLGSTHVTTAHFRPSYIPERSFNYTAITSQPTIKSNATSHEDSEVCEHRPPYLFEDPEPVNVLSMLPDSPPSRLTWEGVEVRLVQGLGPEKISAEWWHREITPHEREREYFRVQDETGRWLWVFRARSTMQWYVHGMWV